MNNSRSRFEFLLEYWQNNPREKQYRYSWERAWFLETFLKPYGPSIISSWQPHSRDLRPDHKRPITSLLKKNGLSSLREEAQMPSNLLWIFITIRKSEKLEKGFKIWFIGMWGKNKKGKHRIVLINNTLMAEEETPQSPPDSGFTTLIF